MKKFFISLLKTILKMIILITATFVMCFAISYFKHSNLNNALRFTGLVYMLVGLLSNLGSASFMGNMKFLQARSAGYRESFENTEDDFRLRDSSLKFMAFMAISGFILCMLSYMIKI
ncbi:hypothetical protein [Clostridium ganghwense]|uniref:DUF3899 domain-containing protein n=1 Tax=Clostridium ganghwense TaxID=312089 RepID=A0ABT4CRA5_9CLOT|nr:hypothetical protein [Clostridium ganghwense]MCY6371595.1 hypothetical protein [Clostridium ganghwense]